MPADRIPPRPVNLEPKGADCTRYAIATAAASLAHGGTAAAEMIARERWPHRPEVARLIRAAVEPGATTSGNWAAQLDVVPALAEFVEALRPATIVGRRSGIRTVPFT